MKKNKDQKTVLFVHNEIKFQDIKFTVDRAKGTVAYDPNPLKAICKDSKLPFDDKTVMLALVALYEKHIFEGGEREALIDEIIGPLKREGGQKNKFLH